MSRTRTVALVLLATGCTKSSMSSTPPTPTRPANSPGATVAIPTAPTPAAKPAAAVDLPAATAAATKFLAGLGTGTPDVAAVAPEFQKTLAGGDEAKASFATEVYLREFAGKVSAIPPAVLPLADGSVLAVTPPAIPLGRTVARLAKVGDGWKVVWLHLGPPGAVPEPTGDPATLSQKFAVMAFVEATLANQPRLAEAAITAASRSAIAPPLGNDPLGFSRGILSQKLANFRGGATGYTLAAVGPTVTGELLGPGGEKRPFKLTLARGAVADFEPR